MAPERTGFDGGEEPIRIERGAAGPGADRSPGPVRLSSRISGKGEAKKVWKPKKVDEEAKSVNVEPEAPSAEAEEETDAPTSA